MRLWKQANHLCNSYKRTQNEIDTEEWRDMKKRYKEEIRRAKELKWKEWVEEADEKTILTVKKYIDKAPSPTTSQQSTMQPQTKEKHLSSPMHSSRHLHPPKQTDIRDAIYPPPVPSNPTITIIDGIFFIFTPEFAKYCKNALFPHNVEFFQFLQQFHQYKSDCNDFDITE